MIFTSFTRNSRAREALVVLITASVGVILNLAGARVSALQIISAVLFVFVLPGYALSILISSEKLALLERLLMSVGISLAVNILLGFAINLTATGLKLTSWTLASGGATLVASLAALIRASSGKGVGGGAINPGGQFRWDPRSVALYSLAALMVVGAIVLARSSAIRQQYPGFTQFWLLPERESAQAAIRLGINNAEGKSAVYRVQVKISGQVIREWDTVAVQGGGRWEATADLPPREREQETIEALLYLAPEPATVYRRTKLERN